MFLARVQRADADPLLTARCSGANSLTHVYDLAVLRGVGQGVYYCKRRIASSTSDLETIGTVNIATRLFKLEEKGVVAKMRYEAQESGQPKPFIR